MKSLENCFALSGQKAEPLAQSHEILAIDDRPEIGSLPFPSRLEHA